jgi:lysozyme family protein
MNNNWDLCKAFTLKVEGGYVDNPNDKGGATKYGITQSTLTGYRGKAVTKDDVKSLTSTEAEQIYKDLYYTPCKCDQLPTTLAIVTFDCAINSGCKQAIKLLQRALEVKDDGIIGNGTLAVASTCDPIGVAHNAIVLRLEFMQGLDSWKFFGNGWTNRLTALQHYIDGV